MPTWSRAAGAKCRSRVSDLALKGIAEPVVAVLLTWNAAAATDALGYRSYQQTSVTRARVLLNRLKPSHAFDTSSGSPRVSTPLISGRAGCMPRSW